MKNNSMALQQWFLIENETTYKKASARYEQLREAGKGTSDRQRNFRT
jgi:hypothetical protein